MGIGCFSVDKRHISAIQNHLNMRKSSLNLHFNSVPILSIPNLDRYSKDAISEDQPNIDNGNTYKVTFISHLAPKHQEANQGISCGLGKICQNNDERNIDEQSLLPNIPYSPFTSPEVSPEHKLRPNGPNHLYSCNYNLGNHQQERRASSVSGTPESIIQLKQYHIRKQLGQGSYGLVQLAYNQENSTYYAMKSLSKKKLMKSCGLFNRPLPARMSASSVSNFLPEDDQKTTDPLQKIHKEIAIHKKLNNPNIVKLIEVLDDPSQQFLYMVFEYVENGAVMQIGQDDPFAESQAKKYFVDTLLGLEYLHYQKIIHRDIKPANLLLSKKDQIKIADFGVSNEFTGDDVYLTSTAGSPAFMAPESVGNDKNTFTGKALDIWALGVTLYAFLFGKIPFENCNRYLLYQMIVNNPIIFPESPRVSKEVLDLLIKMLDKNPLTRIKLKEIKVHDWVTSHGRDPIPDDDINCGLKCIDVTDNDIKNSIRKIPRIETVIKIKTLLKHKSFRNPAVYGSVSKLENNLKYINNLNLLPIRPSSGNIHSVLEGRSTKERPACGDPL